MRTALFAMLMLLAAPVAHAQIAWHSDLKAAHAEAQRSGKQLLLHFYSTDCHWCAKLEREVLADPRVAAVIGARFVAVKIDGELHPELIDAFHITRNPTEVLMTADGDILDQRINPGTSEAFLRMLQNCGSAPAAALAGQPPRADQGFQLPGAPSPSFTPEFPGTTGLAAGHRTGGGLALAPPLNSGSPNAGSPMPARPAQSPAPLSMHSSEDISSAGEPQHNHFALPRSLATAPAPPALSAPQAPIMDGFCLVTAVEEVAWVEGDPRFGAIHLGQLYLFADATAQQKFLVDPDRYAPMLNGIDVVKFFDERKVVAGSREWGMHEQRFNRLFFFSSEETLNRFSKNHERYTDRAMQVMERAAADANPRR